MFRTRWLEGVGIILRFIIFFGGGGYAISFVFGAPYSFTQDIREFWECIGEPARRVWIAIAVLCVLSPVIGRFQRLMRNEREI